MYNEREDPIITTLSILASSPTGYIKSELWKCSRWYFCHLSKSRLEKNGSCSRTSPKKMRLRLWKKWSAHLKYVTPLSYSQEPVLSERKRSRTRRTKVSEKNCLRGMNLVFFLPFSESAAFCCGWREIRRKGKTNDRWPNVWTERRDFNSSDGSQIRKMLCLFFVMQNVVHSCEAFA